MTVEEIRKAIDNWEDIKNKDEALELLTSGYGFEIFKADYLNWKKTAEEYCYVYL